MIRQQHRILYLLIVASLISLLTGCASQRTNSQFTVRVSGNTNGLPFDGQCTAQKAGFWPGESVAQGLDVKGTVYSVSQPQDYETSGYFIYCAVANQSATGTITVELLQDGNVVASAQSISPDKPATLEFGQKPYFKSTKALDVNLSGASDLSGDIEAGDATFDASGASRVTLNGSARNVTVEGSGASHIDLSDFAVADAGVKLSGASTATVNPSGTLDVDASGASHVYYLGNPRMGNFEMSGASSVERK